MPATHARPTGRAGGGRWRVRAHPHGSASADRRGGALRRATPNDQRRRKRRRRVEGAITFEPVMSWPTATAWNAPPPRTATCQASWWPNHVASGHRLEPSRAAPAEYEMPPATRFASGTQPARRTTKGMSPTEAHPEREVGPASVVARAFQRRELGRRTGDGGPPDAGDDPRRRRRREDDEGDGGPGSGDRPEDGGVVDAAEPPRLRRAAGEAVVRRRGGEHRGVGRAEDRHPGPGRPLRGSTHGQHRHGHGRHRRRGVEPPPQPGAGGPAERPAVVAGRSPGGDADELDVGGPDVGGEPLVERVRFERRSSTLGHGRQPTVAIRDRRRSDVTRRARRRPTATRPLTRDHREPSTCRPGRRVDQNGWIGAVSLRSIRSTSRNRSPSPFADQDA